MILIAVVHIVVEILVEHLGLHLSRCVRKGDDLMLRKLHGTSFVNVDMACSYADDTLILIEHRVDGRGISLCSSCQEENLGIGQSAGLADPLFSTLGELVEAIGGGLGTIVFYQIVDHLLASAVIIVAFE